MRSAPLSGDEPWESLSLPGEPPPQEGEGHRLTVHYQVVDPGLFDALGLDLVAGRGLEQRDDAVSAGVAVVNATAARNLWGSRDPVGREVRLGPPPPGGTNPALRVVGVVADARQAGLDRPPPPVLYLPRAQARAVYGGMGARMATVVVRTRGEPRALLPAIRSIVRDMDPVLPLASPRTMGEQVVASVGERRLLAVLMAFFSVTAAVLAAVGLYGLIAYVVSRRTREIGIRYALGAGRASVVASIVGAATATVALGAVVGVGVAWVAGDLLDGLVYGVAPRDPLSLTAAPLLLLAVGLLAAWIPARRAASVEPSEVLREE